MKKAIISVNIFLVEENDLGTDLYQLSVMNDAQKKKNDEKWNSEIGASWVLHYTLTSHVYKTIAVLSYLHQSPKFLNYSNAARVPSLARYKDDLWRGSVAGTITRRA